MPFTKDEQHVDQYARSAGERPRAASKSDGLNFHAAQYTAPKKAAHGTTLVEVHGETPSNYDVAALPEKNVTL